MKGRLPFLGPLCQGLLIKYWYVGLGSVLLLVVAPVMGDSAAGLGFCPDAGLGKRPGQGIRLRKWLLVMSS